MKTMRIAGTDLEVSRVALGCMRLCGAPRQVITTIRAALDQGINLFDHADIYGRGQCEEAFSVIWREIPGLREKVVIQSKCGIRFPGDPDGDAPKRYDLSYEHIIRSVDGSLRRLKTDYLDVLLLHRPDALVEPEEVAQAFDVLHRSGKVRYFGVSNHTAAQIELLRKHVSQPLVINQVQLNVLHLHLIDSGIAFNQDEPPRPLRGDGTLEYCRLHDITVQTWASLANGVVSGRVPEPTDEPLARLAHVLKVIAANRGVSREAILVAWLLRHPARIQPIIGTTHPLRIQAACEGDSVELTREEWYSIYTAGRGAEVP